MTAAGSSLVPAFLAGVVSVVSPCVMGLFPVYVSVLSGSVAAGKRPCPAVVNALGFVAGFSAIFILLGMGAGALGARLPSPQVSRRVAGGFLVVMGIITSGLINLPFLTSERRLLHPDFTGRSLGPGGAALLGIAFSAGWSPCVGPVLASILSVAGVSGGAVRGASLLAAYSLGIAIPFLAAALALDKFREMLPGLLKLSVRIRSFAGILMILVGILYLTGLV